MPTYREQKGQIVAKYYMQLVDESRRYQHRLNEIEAQKRQQLRNLVGQKDEDVMLAWRQWREADDAEDDEYSYRQEGDDNPETLRRQHKANKANILKSREDKLKSIAGNKKGTLDQLEAQHDQEVNAENAIHRTNNINIAKSRESEINSLGKPPTGSEGGFSRADIDKYLPESYKNPQHEWIPKQYQ